MSTGTTKSPNLPIAPVEYSQQYQDQLNNVLMATIKTWKYTPATKNGVRVKVWKTVPLTIKK